MEHYSYETHLKLTSEMSSLHDIHVSFEILQEHGNITDVLNFRTIGQQENKQNEIWVQDTYRSDMKYCNNPQHMGLLPDA